MKGLPLLAAALLAGCASPRPPSAPDPPERRFTGQLRYASPSRNVIGDCSAASAGPRRFDLEFTSGPGLPLLTYQVRGGRTAARGWLARGPGQPGPAWGTLPARFAELPPDALSLEVSDPASGERLSFRFAR